MAVRAEIVSTIAALLCEIRLFSTGQDQTKRIAKPFDTGVDLGAQPTTRASDRLVATAFLGAPAETW